MAIFGSKIFGCGIGVLAIFSGYVIYDYQMWSRDTRTDLDGVELVSLVNATMNRLSTVECSNAILGDLEKLIELYDVQMSRSDAEEHVYLFSDLQDVHAKLGYIYEQAGNPELGNLNFDLAIEYGNRMTPDFYESASIRRFSMRSNRGCFIRED